VTGSDIRVSQLDNEQVKLNIGVVEDFKYCSNKANTADRLKRHFKRSADLVVRFTRNT